MTYNKHYTSIAFIDLDGTLVTVNTWKQFAKRVLTTALRKFRIFTAIKLTAALMLRKMKKISHAEVKYRFMLGSQTVMSRRDIDKFAEKMKGFFNPEVLGLVEKSRSQDALIVLATAAAGEYAEAIALKADIANVICTPAAEKGKPYVECRSEHKADEAEKLCRQLGLPASLVVTDHPDDLPLFSRFPHATHVMIKK